MSPADLLSTLLPISDGRFSISLAPTDGVTLHYVGVEQHGSFWAPEAEEEIDTTIVCELPETVDGRLELALRAWAEVMREAVTALVTNERPSLAAKDVLNQKLLHQLLTTKQVTTEEDFRERWRWHLAASLPFQPAMVAAELAIKEHFEKEGSLVAGGDSDKGRTSLEFANTERRDGSLHMVVRLIVWDKVNDELIIRDVKEQEIRFLTPGPGLEPARITAFLTAFNECLSLWLAKPEVAAEVETLMPHDMMISPQDYKSGQTVDDFRKLLRRKLKLD